MLPYSTDFRLFHFHFVLAAPLDAIIFAGGVRHAAPARHIASIRYAAVALRYATYTPRVYAMLYDAAMPLIFSR